MLFRSFIIFSGLTQPLAVSARVFTQTLQFLGQNALSFYISLLLYGGVTLISEWGQIAAPAWRKAALLVLFPLFMLTYIPISLAALFCRVEWKPIRHHSSAALNGRARAYPRPQPVPERAERAPWENRTRKP